MAADATHLKMMRVVVREDFSRARCDGLVADMKLAVDTLKKMDTKGIEEHQAHVKKNVTSSGQAKHNAPKYRKEKHSQQGKTGKTHAVC